MEVPDKDYSTVEEDAEEPLEKSARTTAASTLKGVLHNAGLLQFVPEANDSETHALARVSLLQPHMHAFASFVRCEEKLLSKRRVLGDSHWVNERNVYQSELSIANQEFHCSSQRQSRRALWYDFSNRAVACATAEEEQDSSGGPAVKRVEVLKPSSSLSSEGERLCQVVVVRPCLAGDGCGPMRLGLLD